MSLRSYLVAHHTAEADHHVRRAKECEKMAHSHDAMKACMSLGPDVQQHHKEMAECYKAQAAEHVRMGEHHVQKARECSTIDLGETHGPKVAKLASDADRFSRIEADGVQAIHGGVPEGLRLVSRFGAPDAAELEKAAATNLEQHPAFQRRDTSAA